MAYATKHNVKMLFRDFPADADAAIPDTHLDTFLDQTSAVIDARLSGLYSLPITELGNPASFVMLAHIQSMYVASMVDDILNNYTEADKKPNWYKRAMEQLNMIAPLKNSKGEQPEPSSFLPDADYLGTNIQKGKFKLSSTDTAIFKKGVDNW